MTLVRAAFSFVGFAFSVSLALAQPAAPTKEPAAPAAKTEVFQKTPTTVIQKAEASSKSANPPVDPLDWPMWRGPEQNGMSRETGLIDTFDLASKKNVLWSNPEAGGISTPIIFRGKLYTIVRHEHDTPREQEKVLCLNAATGEPIWQRTHNVYLSDVPAERVGWSCCVADAETGTIFAQGVNGYFECLDAETGKVIWSRSLHEEMGLLSTYGGRTNVPVVFDDLVIVSAVMIGWGDLARPAHRFLGMDKRTGEIRWLNGTKELPPDTTYSTPVIKVVDGQAQMIFGSSDGSYWGFQPRTGKPIWNYKLSRRGINVTPLVVGDTMYIAQGEENVTDIRMGAVAAVNLKGAKGDITDKKEHLLWQQFGVTIGKSSPILVDGRLYCIDDSSNLFIFDAETGKQITARPIKLLGALTRGSPLYADGRIYFATTTGLHVLQPTPEGAKIAVRARLASGKEEINASFVVSHGRLYIQTTLALYCLGKPDQQTAATEQPQPTPEPAGDKVATHLQVVPCELLMAPGQVQKFRVRTYNALGQFLAEVPATFTLAGPGTINDQGAYASAPGNQHTATILTAKAGELTGTARIRVVPPLPWKFDFNDIALAEVEHPVTKAKIIEGEPPITWVGIRHRHKIREIDGEKVMVKVNTIPLGTRSQGWMGPWNMSNYTIQADLRGRGTKVGFDNLLPDMGLIAQRYTLDMMGQKQQLQFRTWTSQIKTRFSKEVPFAWKPDVWYTMKFSASVEGGKAVLRGKVWERDKPEPTGWLIEAVDEEPNTVGAPGFFGNASVCEIHIDNVSVYPNPEKTAGK